MRIPNIPYVQGRNNYTDADGLKYGIAIHCTANTASARNEAGYASRRTDGVSAHLYVDNVEVVQSLDTAARAGHSGSSEGNDHALAVEITGLVSWTRDRWLTSVAWDKLAAALAYVIRNDGSLSKVQVRRATVTEMQANPKVRAFFGHDDMRRAWGGTTHTDPGPNFPWDRLLQAVSQALAPAGRPAVKEDNTMKLDADDLAAVAHKVAGFQWPPADSVDPKPGLAFYSYARDAAAAATLARNELALMRAELRAMAGQDWVDEQAIVDGILTGLAGRSIDAAADALAAVFADRVGELAAALVSRIPAES